ncbi:MAG: hypothetical protein ACJAVI_002595 [Candidatus Azotimanducaceae bacterium]|jgi:hypothetical protein
MFRTFGIEDSAQDLIEKVHELDFSNPMLVLADVQTQVAAGNLAVAMGLITSLYEQSPTNMITVGHTVWL